MPPMEQVAGGSGGGRGMQPPSSEGVMDGCAPWEVVGAFSWEDAAAWGMAEARGQHSSSSDLLAIDFSSVHVLSEPSQPHPDSQTSHKPSL